MKNWSIEIIILQFHMCLTSIISTGYVIEITSLPQISNRLLCSRNQTIEPDNCEIIYSTTIQMGDYICNHIYQFA